MSVLVTVARLPFDAAEEICLARRAEIESCTSEAVKLRKTAVWKLLLTALKSGLGLDPAALTFFCKNGKWGAENVEFSLSHSRNYIAVAVSDAPVGVDVEELGRFRPAFCRILTDEERAAYDGAGDKTLFLAEAWTRKEAAFKRSGNFFVPANTPDFASFSLDDGQGNAAVLSVTPPPDALHTAGDLPVVLRPIPHTL